MVTTALEIEKAKREEAAAVVVSTEHNQPVTEQTAHQTLTQQASENLGRMEHPATAEHVTPPQDLPPVKSEHLEAIGTTTDVATNFVAHQFGRVVRGDDEERKVGGGESEIGSSGVLGRIQRMAKAVGGIVRPRENK